MKKILVVFAVCFAVFSVPYFLKEEGLYPQDSMFFFYNASLSLLIIIVLSMLKPCLVTILIQLLNFTHIIMNVITCYEYMTMIYPYGMFYNQYKFILNSLNLLEFFVLIFGVNSGMRRDRDNSKYNGVSYSSLRSFNRRLQTA